MQKESVPKIKISKVVVDQTQSSVFMQDSVREDSSRAGGGRISKGRWTP